MSTTARLPEKYTQDQVKAYRDKHKCGIRDAKKHVHQKYRSDLKDTVIALAEDATTVEDLQELLLITLKELV